MSHYLLFSNDTACSPHLSLMRQSLLIKIDFNSNIIKWYSRRKNIDLRHLLYLTNMNYSLKMVENLFRCSAPSEKQALLRAWNSCIFPQRIIYIFERETKSFCCWVLSMNKVHQQIGCRVEEKQRKCNETCCHFKPENDFWHIVSHTCRVFLQHSTSYLIVFKFRMKKFT